MNSFGRSAIALLVIPVVMAADKKPAESPRLLLAFCSYRDRPAFTGVFLYEHDGVGQGRIIGSLPTADDTAFYRPSLSPDGRVCAYTAKKAGGNVGHVRLWDVVGKKPLEFPELEVNRVEPAMAGGDLLAAAVWAGPGGAGGWDLTLVNWRTGKAIETPGLNSAHDEREAVLSGDGRFVAFSSHRPGGAGSSDIYLYDREVGKLVPLLGLNTGKRELSPSLSADGRWLAFTSDRPGGEGGKDVYLYDREAGKLVPLPGLNSVGHDQTPSISPDGRYIAFVSERAAGPGERDVYLYDREAKKLIPTPGLNSKAEDFDPSLGAWPKR